MEASTTDADRLSELLAAAKVRIAELEQALENRTTIEQAKGVLAERLALSVTDAYELLRYAARTARMRAHELAALVVEEPSTPGPVRIALARQARWRAAYAREQSEAAQARASALLDAARHGRGRAT